MILTRNTTWPDLFSRHLTLLVTALLASLITQVASAGAEELYPEFVAHYIVRANGIKVGKATFSLQREGADEYIYRQHSESTGIGALLGADTSTQSSRWRYVDGEIQPLEFRSQRKHGDDDDNAHLFFDWKQMRVVNHGAGKHWDIAFPDGTLDSLSMQLAMLFDLRDNKTHLKYDVAMRGRIKHYLFEVAGQDTIKLPFGSYETVRAERRDDKKDDSLIWSAPALNYFPVRFIKKKRAGLEVELLLQKLDFGPPHTTQGEPGQTDVSGSGQHHPDDTPAE